MDHRGRIGPALFVESEIAEMVPVEVVNHDRRDGQASLLVPEAMQRQSGGAVHTVVFEQADRSVRFESSAQSCAAARPGSCTINLSGLDGSLAGGGEELLLRSVDRRDEAVSCFD